MATEVKIPIPDQTTEEVRIVKWHKAVGDAVSNGEIVLEVETDKSVIEVEAAGGGVLLVAGAVENDMVPVGRVVGMIGEKGEKAELPSSGGEKAAPSKASPAASATPAASAVAAPASNANVTEIKIPIPDQTTEEVRIVKWHKAVGDAVSNGEIVLEVETDKSVIEVEAAGDGVLLAAGAVENDMVPVGTVIGMIGEKGTKVELPSGGAKPAPSKAAAPTPAAASKPIAAPAAPAATAAPISNARVKASPVAKKVAARLGVDLQLVKGTGPNGRIVKDDVERFSASGGAAVAAAPAAVVRAKFVDGRIVASPNAKRLAAELAVDLSQIAGSGADGRIVGPDVTAAAKAGTARPTGAVVALPAIPLTPANGQPQPGTEVELTRMRRAIGMNLQMSSRDTPHFNVTMSVEMSRAMAFRKKINNGAENGQRVSVNDLVVKACAVALKQYPAVNCRLTENTIKYIEEINIGIATAVADGLVVPVLTDVPNREWREMAVEAKRISGEARRGKIIGAGKGTFTVSNLGMFGVEQFTAIINPPEAAILAVGALRDEVVAVDGMIAIRPMMNMTLCSDHRLVDGALAAEFLRAVKVYLEDQIG